MKKVFVLGLVLFLAGCNSTAPQLDPIDFDAEEVVDEVEESENSDEELTGYDVYEQWAIDPPYGDEDEVFREFTNMAQNEDLAYNLSGKDCVGVWNGETYGGDLLSTIIVQNESVEFMDLDLYLDQAYVENLEIMATSHGRAKFGKDFYAFYACNLDENLDLLGGTYWPEGEDSCYEFGDTKKFERCFGDERAVTALVLVNDGSVYSFEDVKLYNNTVTGGEVVPCSMSYQDGIILWDCFEQANFDEGQEYRKLYEITLDGDISDSVEYIKDVDLGF